MSHELRVEYKLVYHSLWFPVMKCASMCWLWIRNSFTCLVAHKSDDMS